ncbi:polysaccharide pyruvyl transferase CsaB [Sphaerospermopsis aphanizomenoides BCCUSP55]|uniref:polysaccharide pyruvyl transferase CsaB n=1 Tax=Sphaerospermopsis aphanizomenoides TaxID=459663 RepID=UPI0019080583|nr:polysaccharide pyruvyl transferase CsaB [Sphaerospermopsis aphanizomenoides]MBK1989148.1 polysaccharide pyruvyl transferase CsaB [Sphaerospermopsis aphanizomenoides BCCUSP55]
MRVLLSGYYGKGNGGDEALLATLLQMLPPHVTPVVLSGNPEETSRRYGVESYNRMAFLQVIKALRSCDVFIWGGGSLMQDVTSTISPFYYGGLMAIAQVMGLKTVAWGQGIGPLLRPQTRWLAKRNFAGCIQVSVRDRKSSALLSDWGIPHILAPDPVWALESKPVSELADLPKPRIAVTLRNHSQLTKNRLINLTSALVSLQQTTQALILLLPFQKSEDLEIAEQIHLQLKNNSQILCLEDPQLLKGAFQGVDMVIGMRLHSLIMAASEGCRCFALSYDPKVNRLMEDLEIPGWDLQDLPDDANIISKNWIDYYKNSKSLSSEKIESLVNGAFLHRELLEKIL